MEIITTLAAMVAWSQQTRAQARTIALVPTMGFFHDGHLSLMRQAANEADVVVVSLFVNPIQFGENEDLSTYPRDLARDEALASAQGVDVLFCPCAEELYPPHFQTTVQVAELTSSLCGASRPGHFDGVTTVVSKLFNLVGPQVAIFGQKDLQQLMVVRRMVVDLNFPVRIIAHPIVREADGLAMSSRNSYLSLEERQQALCLSQALTMAQHLAEEKQTAAQIEEAARSYISATPGVAVEYIKIIDERTMQGSSCVDSHAVLALAVRVGQTRLIDNGWLLSG